MYSPTSNTSESSFRHCNYRPVVLARQLSDRSNHIFIPNHPRREPTECVHFQTSRKLERKGEKYKSYSPNSHGPSLVQQDKILLARLNCGGSHRSSLSEFYNESSTSDFPQRNRICCNTHLRYRDRHSVCRVVSRLANFFSLQVKLF